MGIGFAIPINMARKVMEDLIYEGRVIRGYAGVSVQEINSQISQAMNLETTQGALVADVPNGQPAQKAGIKVGDVIVSVAGQTVQNANDLTNIIASLQPGKEVPIVIIRDGKTMTLTLKPVDRSTAFTNEEPMRQQPRPQRGDVHNKTGIGVEELTSEIKRALNLPDNFQGVAVVRVAPEITDNRAMLRQGDVVVRAKSQEKSWKAITNVDEYITFADQLKTRQAVVLQVQRQDRTFIISFETR
jgi:serine protease Do